MQGFDVVLRVAGGAIAIAMAVGLALLEAVSTPGPWFIAVPAALIGNVFLAWFAVSTVERGWAWLLPAVPWTVIMLLAIAPTSEGDQLANSWTGLGAFAAGAFGFLMPIMRPNTHKMGVSGISH
ncbi:hypothetical protein [Allorhizocola rhizosphaerae]|uniref:hypothetical protein n=1 Tax=Allorhizocola rhizosphaerae TaxID=1872709 RepID=UPI000E3E5776|nr:hypothetical protein [Allorhizocola rhizosphaerae]